jgi:hypothetical protein
MSTLDFQNNKKPIKLPDVNEIGISYTTSSNNKQLQSKLEYINNN